MSARALTLLVTTAGVVALAFYSPKVAIPVGTGVTVLALLHKIIGE